MSRNFATLNIESLEKKISKNKILKHICYFKKIDSTNDYAEKIIENGRASSGTIIIAEEQTNGHGRKSRSWFSPKFVNFYGTFIIKNKIDYRDSFFLNVITSLAIYKTLQQYKLDNCVIKWPNDILVQQKKIAGILTKILSSYCFIGIGININWNPHNSLDLKDKATSILQITKKPINREVFIAKLLIHWEKYYCQYFNKKNSLLKKWKDALYLPEKQIQIYSDGNMFEGTIVEIKDDGGLVLNTQSQNKVILYNIDKF